MAPLRRSAAGWVPAKIGRSSAGVGRRHPVISQGVIDGGVDEAGMSTAAPDKSAVLFLLNGPRLRWLFVTLLLSHPGQIQQAASRVRRVMSTLCEVTRGVGIT